MICIKLKRNADWQWVLNKGRYTIYIDPHLRAFVKEIGNCSMFHLMKPNNEDGSKSYNDMYACFRERREAMMFALLMEEVNIRHKEEYQIRASRKWRNAKQIEPMT